MKKHIISTVVLFSVAFISILPAQWSTDPSVNNAICVQAGEQSDPAIASDGSGGVIIVWCDDRNGNSDIYAQRISASGVIQWTANGILVCSQVNVQLKPVIVGDGSGGALIAWQDFRADDGDIYVQRINSSGAVQWSADGAAVCTDAGAQYNPTITADGSGGAIIAWHDFRNHIHDDIFAQRITSTGDIQWTMDGIALCSQTGNQRYPSITADGSGGAIVTWQDERNGSGNPDVFAQRVSGNGTEQWIVDGVAVCTLGTFQQEPKIAGNGNGGAIIVWHDNRNGNPDVFAQMIDANGTVQWTGTPDGAPVCVLAGTQVNPSIVSDGNGGAIVAWTDSRNIGTSSIDMYAQRINSNGSTQWGTDVTISNNSTQQNYPVIAEAGNGGAVIAWYDYRNSDNDIYASLVSADGVLPVELVSFIGTARGSDVELKWRTAGEVNNYGFEVERKEFRDSGFEMNGQNTNPKPQNTNQKWMTIGFVEGNGNSTVSHEYRYTDHVVSSGTFSFRLKQIDRDGAFTYSQEVDVVIGGAPEFFGMEQNFPNPFNPTTSISFQLSSNSQTKLSIMDNIGREAAVLVNEMKGPGAYTVQWNASNFASGTYFVRLKSGEQTQVMKLILMK